MFQVGLKGNAQTGKRLRLRQIDKISDGSEIKFLGQVEQICADKKRQVIRERLSK